MDEHDILYYRSKVWGQYDFLMSLMLTKAAFICLLFIYQKYSKKHRYCAIFLQFKIMGF